MPQDYTIIELTPRGTVDNYGNQQVTVKFAEYPNQVYAAFKTMPAIGTKKWGTIKTDGGNGPAFKSAKKEFNNAPQGSFAPQANQQRSNTPKKSDDERSKDIRWGLCLKEANLYVSKTRADLDATTWSKEVVEYASALYAVSAEPTQPAQVIPEYDQLPDDMLENHGLTAEDLAEIPFN